MTVNRMSKSSLATPAKYRNLRAGNVEVTGGLLSEDATYFYRTFTASGNLTVVGGSLTADVLVIGGGAGGGYQGGGGGAGGFRTASSMTIVNGSFAIAIGAGGSGGNYSSGTSGSSTIFPGITSAGGGVGGPETGGGTAGGSGGGGGCRTSVFGGAGNTPNTSPSQGNNGGNGDNGNNGGGGGGAGAPGVLGTGGAGKQWLPGGSYYAGGGGAWGYYSNHQGGIGGGGQGERGQTVSGSTSGTVNTGSGGGGGQIPAAGGSGLVVVRYAKSSITSTFADYELIGTVTLASTTGDITFTGIPQQYKHLQVRAVTRTVEAATASSFVLQFNGDTGTNYQYQHMWGNGTSVPGYNATSQTVIYPGATAGNSVATNVFASHIIDIPEYTNTSKFKVTKAIGGSPSYSNVFFDGGQWNSLSAITSIKFFASASFAAGTKISLYGLRA